MGPQLNLYLTKGKQIFILSMWLFLARAHLLFLRNDVISFNIPFGVLIKHVEKTVFLSFLYMATKVYNTQL